MDHVKEAESCIRLAEDAHEPMYLLARAQVHATLALASHEPAKEVYLLTSYDPATDIEISVIDAYQDRDTAFRRRDILNEGAEQSRVTHRYIVKTKELK